MLLPEFKKLRKKPDHAVGLPDLLNYAAFGSVTEAVVRKATCPVLTVREEIPAADASGKK